MVELFAETYRLHLMRRLEGVLAQCGYPRVAGVDEVGRGCLAGPVVAAAVVPDPESTVPGVDDSKRLSAEARESLAESIHASALATAVVAVPASIIDRINILEATRKASSEALAKLDPAPDCAVTDALPLAGAPCLCLPVVRADSTSYAVACASIIAKVARDRLMRRFGREYPHYGFSSNKGYGAPEHLEALRHHGPSPVHRLTFRRVVPRTGEKGRVA